MLVRLIYTMSIFTFLLETFLRNSFTTRPLKLAFVPLDLSRPRMPCTMMWMPKRQKPSDISFCLLSFFVDCRLIYQIIKCFFLFALWLLTPQKTRERDMSTAWPHTAAWGKRSCKRHLKEEPLLS